MFFYNSNHVTLQGSLSRGLDSSLTNVNSAALRDQQRGARPRRTASAASTNLQRRQTWFDDPPEPSPCICLANRACRCVHACQSTVTVTETQTAPAATVTVVHLKSEERRLKWGDDVVDNEGMGKKSSKSTSTTRPRCRCRFRCPFSVYCTRWLCCRWNLSRGVAVRCAARMTFCKRYPATALSRPGAVSTARVGAVACPVLIIVHQ